MPDGTGMLMTPITAGLCKYESLKEGTLDLIDVLRMNDALAVQAENQRRIDDAYRRHG